MGFGRPEEYKPEYCERILEMGKKGMHAYQMAMELDVCKKTLYTWAEKHIDFLHAFTRARDHAKAVLISKAFENIDNKNFQPKLFEFMMKFLYDVQESRVVHLPELKTMESLADGIKKTIIALSDGRITPDEAKKVAETIQIAAKVEESEELKPLLDELRGKVEHLIK